MSFLIFRYFLKKSKFFWIYLDLFYFYKRKILHLSRADVAIDAMGEWHVTTWRHVYAPRGVQSVRVYVCGHTCVHVCARVWLVG